MCLNSLTVSNRGSWSSEVVTIVAEWRSVLGGVGRGAVLSVVMLVFMF